MKKEFYFKAELNAQKQPYDVTTDLEGIYPNAHSVLKNCINSREWGNFHYYGQRDEIINAINEGLSKLHIRGVFHQSEICFGEGCVKLLKGGISI